jgi:ABC-type methionine transport system ATPase subunit
MNENVQNIISRLRFLAKIQHGEKINVRELFVRDNDSLVQRCLRTARNLSTYISASEMFESKDSTILFIRTTINEAIALIFNYQKSTDKYERSVAYALIKDLEDSTCGIKHLMATYQGDRKFTSDADAIIQTMDIRLKSIKGKD